MRQSLLILPLSMMFVCGCTTTTSSSTSDHPETVAELQPDIPKLTEIIDAQSSCLFSDGTSCYQFYKDGSFRLGPIGMSGLTINGTWSTSDELTFVIVGKWGWINGISRNDDYRKMTLSVSLLAGQPEADRVGLSQLEVYPVNFTIEKTEELSKEEYEKVTESNQLLHRTQ